MKPQLSDRQEAAVTLIREVDRQGRELRTELDAAIVAGRRAGLSWQDIGDAMGMTARGASLLAVRHGLPVRPLAEETTEKATEKP